MIPPLPDPPVTDDDRFILAVTVVAPSTCNPTIGVVVPMPTKPALSIVMRCEPAVDAANTFADGDHSPVSVSDENENTGADTEPRELARNNGVVTLVPIVGELENAGAPAFAVSTVFAPPCAVI